MKVKEKDVQHVAALANLELTAEESMRMLQDLNAVLDHIDMLNEVDTANVAPMAFVAADITALRSDETRASLPRDEALSNAPEAGMADGRRAFFKVPKVIER
ncbi:MAG: Asp-tRNA(Asn)/Glu-tRNA(Gln) amidotransferase subunit GatC [Candidatus Koribacter versatilis]|uniref:Aspartyl/glutamyl-tRNA(Asn/Gln) amidotransferase subunit C n=1 Tax=Candidatus Korobacter versatilis TaxID=658062 RepID=A0A932A911_9BACT|nr:Asp-tRNA(Asn)/Glu-tRNA(Gln) amidotransferase subunit GatC [Candidatus Koribacter versatilis]